MQAVVISCCLMVLVLRYMGIRHLVDCSLIMERREKIYHVLVILVFVTLSVLAYGTSSDSSYLSKNDSTILARFDSVLSKEEYDNRLLVVSSPICVYCARLINDMAMVQAEQAVQGRAVVNVSVLIDTSAYRRLQYNIINHAGLTIDTLLSIPLSVLDIHAVPLTIRTDADGGVRNYRYGVLEKSELRRMLHAGAK